MKTVVLLTLAGMGLFLGNSKAWAVDLTKTLVVEADTDKTSKDIDVKFELQRTTWAGENLQIFAKLKNETDKDYRYVEAIITVYDKEGNFITRSTSSTYPELLGKKKVGYLDANYVETGDQIPARVTIKLTGEEDDGNNF